MMHEVSKCDFSTTRLGLFRPCPSSTTDWPFFQKICLAFNKNTHWKNCAHFGKNNSGLSNRLPERGERSRSGWKCSILFDVFSTICMYKTSKLNFFRRTVRRFSLAAHLPCICWILKRGRNPCTAFGPLKTVTAEKMMSRIFVDA